MIDEFHGPLDAAIYATVHDYKDSARKTRGAVALAARIGMQPGTLSNKANPTMDAQLTLRESIPLQLVASDFRILHAYAAELGHVAWELPDHPDASDVEVLDLYAEFHSAVGDKARAIRAALRDGAVHPCEVDEIRNALHGLIRAGLSLLSRFEALADD